jgi:hypothetical protein
MTETKSPEVEAPGAVTAMSVTFPTTEINSLCASVDHLNSPPNVGV